MVAITDADLYEVQSGHYSKRYSNRKVNLLKKKKIFLKKLDSCMSRDLDAAKCANYFKANRCRIVENPAKADFIVLITCAFCKNREDEAFDAIKCFTKYKAELVVLGCAPAIAKQRMQQEFGGKSLRTEELEAVDKFFPDFKIKFKDIEDPNDLYSDRNHARWKTYVKQFRANPKLMLGRIKMFLTRRLKKMAQILAGIKTAGRCSLEETVIRKPIRICSGCLGNCSFCVVRFATGRLRSKSLNQCATEYRGLLKQGYRKFDLIGEDVGAWGLDIGSSFPELLFKFQEIAQGSNCKIGISFLNPQWLVKYKEAIKDMAKASTIDKIQCDLQAGSKRILELMNRYADVESIIDGLQDIKKVSPGLIIAAEFIVGFPSESDDDFQDTVNMIKALNLDHGRCFAYTDREGAASSQFPDQMPPEIIEKRLKRLKDNLKETYRTIRFEPELTSVYFAGLLTESHKTQFIT